MTCRAGSRRRTPVVGIGVGIRLSGQVFPLAGARAYVEIGATQRRTTATRVVLGSVVTLGFGTVVGAMAKKKTSNVYVTVELADGQVIVVEADAKQEGKAREFAAALTSAAAVATRTPGGSGPCDSGCYSFVSTTAIATRACPSGVVSGPTKRSAAAVLGWRAVDGAHGTDRIAVTSPEFWSSSAGPEPYQAEVLDDEAPGR